MDGNINHMETTLSNQKNIILSVKNPLRNVGVKKQQTAAIFHGFSVCFVKERGNR